MGSHRPQPDMMTARRDRSSDVGASQALGIFLSWLLWLPDEADPAIAARTEIDRIDRLAGGVMISLGARLALFADSP